MRSLLAVIAALALTSCATMSVPPQAGKKPQRDFFASITLVDKEGTCVLGDKTTDIRAHGRKRIFWQVYSDCASKRRIQFVNWQPATPPCIANRKVDELVFEKSYTEFRRNVTGAAGGECTFDVEICDENGAGCAKYDPRILIEN